MKIVPVNIFIRSHTGTPILFERNENSNSNFVEIEIDLIHLQVQY